MKNILQKILFLLIIVIASGSYVCAQSDKKEADTSETQEIKAEKSKNNKRVLRQFLEANEPQPKLMIKIGDQEYEQSVVVADFNRMALSDHVWLSDGDRKQSRNYIDTNKYKSNEDFENRFRRYHARLDGVPPIHVINKWPKDRDIIIKMKNASLVYYEEEPAVARIVKEKIEKLIPQIESLTGLKFTAYWMLTKDEQKKIDLQKEPLIEFTYYRTLGNSHNSFKSRRFLPSGFPPNFDRHMERGILGAVHLTPDTRSQVEGYFVPNANNVIDFGRCQFLIGLQKNREMVEALASECMYRLMGVPNASDNQSLSILGQWNEPNDAHSLRWVFDGEKSFAPPVEVEEDVVDHLPIEPSAYDNFMLCLLYHDDFKPGMSANVASSKAIDLIKNDFTCEGSL